MENHKRRASPFQAIRRMCNGCVGGSPSEIKVCPVVDCPLWDWRLGVHPETAASKYPHLLDAPLLRRVVPQADAIVGSNSAADIIEYLKQQHHEANKSPPSTPVTTSETTLQEA